MKRTQKQGLLLEAYDAIFYYLLRFAKPIESVTSKFSNFQYDKIPCNASDNLHYKKSETWITNGVGTT